MTDSIPDALIAAAERFPEREAVVDGSVRLTFAELHRRVRECARFFVAGGVRSGDRVAVCSPNTHHWMEAALGALYAGAVLVPVNTRYTGHELLDILQRTRATAFVVAGPFLGVDRLADVRAAAHSIHPALDLPDLRLILRIPIDAPRTSRPESGAEVSDPLPPDRLLLEWTDIPDRAATVTEEQLTHRLTEIDPAAPGDILFTSGTTGRSKGAMSSHIQSLSVARAWAQTVGLTERDRYLVVNPFFHSFGYKAGILAALQSGATVIPQLTFDADATMRLIESERISVLPAVPTVYQTLLDHPEQERYDLSSLRVAVTGATNVPVVLVERMRTALKLEVVLTAYGLTEAVVATMCRPDDDAQTVARTCGQAAAGFEVRIDAPAGTPGEVLLRGPNTMLGYLDDPAATAAAIDAQGWLHTGDIGVLDARGYLTITDRLKDMYVCGGFNVYPAEVEQALCRLDEVAAAAVIGVPDRRLGEVGKAYLVLRPGRTLTEERVLEHAKTFLAGFKIPRQVEFVADLPRNATGKVMKHILRERNM